MAVMGETPARDSVPRDVENDAPMAALPATGRDVEPLDFSARDQEPVTAFVSAPVAADMPRPAARDEWRVPDSPARPAPAPDEPVARPGDATAATSYAMPLTRWPR
jgi:hypothetical protein